MLAPRKVIVALQAVSLMKWKKLWFFALSYGPPLVTDLIIGLLLRLRLFLAIAQKINQRDTKAQICLFFCLW